ncbi:MAG: hypothetical protein WCE21_03805 [Candidatus Babeliales bacterium]
MIYKIAQQQKSALFMGIIEICCLPNFLKGQKQQNEKKGPIFDKFDAK